MEETIKAVGYARFSSSMQREESITAQKRYMMMYAKRNNMEVIDWYCDEAKSAKTVNRPAFQKMINDAKNNPEFKAVLVHKTDRFSRNLSDSIHNTKNFLKNTVCKSYLLMSVLKIILKVICYIT